jgi:uncharacterized membrane protein YfcA
MLDSRPSPHPALLVAGGFVVVAVLVAFPVEALTIAMLLAIATMVMSIYVLWQRLHPLPPERRAVVERRLPAITGTLVAGGIVLALARPLLVAPVAFGLTVASCLTLLAFELAAGRSTADQDDRHSEHQPEAHPERRADRAEGQRSHA